MHDLKKELNETQYQAAIHTKGPLLVIAGAGSGKTRVITFRIANLIQQHRVPPWRIMAVTFTNKAAKEMSERVEKLVGDGPSCWISTFHSSCAKLLRIYGKEAGINPQFTIYDDSDQQAMIKRVLKELDLDVKQFPPKAISNEINKAKQNLQSPNDYPESDFYRRNVKTIYELYERRMRDANALDFGDLLYRTVRAMQDSKELAQEISGKFDYVLVDEFQDTNEVQLELVRLLTPHRNICVVGDDDQSIYSWRGANIANILNFEKIFSGAKLVTLDRNYRSSKNILNAAHGVVRKLRNRRDKELWTSSEAGAKIALHFADDERQEARFVARKVKELQQGGVSYADQVVFYRTNSQSRVIEEVFRSQNIPHKIVGGMRFYERAEVKDILAYLRLIQNPADHTALIRIINTPTRGIGKTTVDKLVAIAAGHGESAFEAIDRASGELGAAPAKKLVAFKNMVENWQMQDGQGLTHLAEAILADTGYVAKLEKEDTADADARIDNIKELVGSMADFEEDAEESTLHAFLELVALQTDMDNTNFDDEQVTLMTVHASKGLEFDTVYVTGMEERVFPLMRGDDVGIEDTEEMDEERRLAYVAMTRAEKRLFLTRAIDRRTYGRTTSNPPSRFLRDIPPEITELVGSAQPRSHVLQTGRAYGGPPQQNGYDSRATFGRQTDFFSQREQMQGRAASMGARTAAGTANANGARAGVNPMGSRASSNWTPPKRNKPAPKNTSFQRDKESTWVDKSFDQSSMALTPGMEVSHAKFGRGKVMNIIAGPKPKVDVLFPVYGRKTILAKFLDLD